MSNDITQPHTHEHADDNAHDHSAGHEPTVEGAAAPRWVPSLADLSRQSYRVRFDEVSDLDLDKGFEAAWHDRRVATEMILGATEEKIARLVARQFPEAKEIVLYEDHSHDAAHAHVLHVLGADGEVLISGIGDLWHEQSWTGDIDEFAWDLYNLHRQGFTAEGETRTRHISVSSIADPDELQTAIDRDARGL